MAATPAEGGRVAAVLAEIAALGSEADRAGMARYGIKVDDAYGVSVTVLRRLAKDLGHDHELALELWRTGNHEARLLAAFVDEPDKVDERQMEGWAADFDSWDVCDEVTTDLFDRTPFAWKQAVAWAGRPEEFVKRAGFALMAGLAVHDKTAGDEAFAGAPRARRARSLRRAQLRQEGGQLGAAQHRQAQPASSTGGAGVRSAPARRRRRARRRTARRRRRRARGALGGQRRLARAALAEGARPARGGGAGGRGSPEPPPPGAP